MTAPSFENFSYTALLTLVPNYMERKDAAFIAQMPVFIALAENRLASDLKTLGFQQVVNSKFDLQPLQKKPAFWRETLAYTFTGPAGKATLRLRSLEWIQAYWPDPTVKDVPLFYADYNANYFYVGPTPSTAWPVELSYYARLNPLGPSNDSNWMTTYMPQALFYAICKEGAIWAKNAERAGTFDSQYMQCLGSLAAEGADRLTDRNQVVK